MNYAAQKYCSHENITETFEIYTIKMSNLWTFNWCGNRTGGVDEANESSGPQCKKAIFTSMSELRWIIKKTKPSLVTELGNIAAEIVDF